MTKTIFKRLIPVFWILSISLESKAVPVLPAGRLEYDFIYERIERLQTLESGLFDYQIGPYVLEKEEFGIEPLYYLKPEQTEQLNFFGVGGEEYLAARNNSAEAFESFRGGLAAQPFDRIYVYGNFVLDESRAADPNYSGKKWRGLAGDVEQALANYHTDRFNLTLGRFASFWGPRNSLVLGPHVPLDGVGYAVKWGKLTLSYRIARLDGLNPDEDSVAQFENRFFAGHRLDIHLTNRIRIGFFETVVFGGPGRSIELYYLNPIIFFHGSQVNDGADDNTFVGLDFDYVPRNGLRFFGQFLIDDIQIEHKTQGDQEPNEIGLLVGTHWVNAFKNTDAKVSYTRVTNRTYNQGNERNRYTHDGQLLSGALGNDYDQWSLQLLRWIGNDLNAGLNLAYTRQGEGRVTDPWTTPWLNVSGDYNEPFPTGTVEKTFRAAVSFGGFFGRYMFAKIEGGFDEIKNLEHTFGDNQTRPFVNLKISAFFSGSVNVE
ncbi:MAG TPA: capsule assembly Wzi family protein [candidate division Zixibacteria bacterium]|nr:capsule assembly Wzi family protein [candidate division Zixibacteria bacterium]